MISLIVQKSCFCKTDWQNVGSCSNDFDLFLVTCLCRLVSAYKESTLKKETQQSKNYKKVPNALSEKHTTALAIIYCMRTSYALTAVDKVGNYASFFVMDLVPSFVPKNNDFQLEIWHKLDSKPEAWQKFWFNFWHVVKSSFKSLMFSNNNSPSESYISITQVAKYVLRVKRTKTHFSDAYFLFQNLTSDTNDLIQTSTHCEFSDSKSDGL